MEASRSDGPDSASMGRPLIGGPIAGAAGFRFVQEFGRLFCSGQDKGEGSPGSTRKKGGTVRTYLRHGSKAFPDRLTAASWISPPMGSVSLFRSWSAPPRARKRAGVIFPGGG